MSTSSLAVRPVPARPDARRLTVVVQGADPVTGAGVTSQLRFRPELEVVSPHGRTADVVVVVADEVDAERLRQVRRAVTAGSRVVLVVSRLTSDRLLEAVHAGSSAVLRRRDATADGLAGAVRAAARGDGSMPPDLLAALVHQLGSGVTAVPQARAVRPSDVSQRELRVLRLLAEGCTTSEIAAEMAYSERTIKNFIQELMTRLQLRNRPHAVAFAMRQGLI